MAWINELLCLFKFAAFKSLFYGLIYPEVNTGNWALQLLRPIIHALPYNPGMDIPGRGTCKRSSAAVVQQSALRWPANILQRKKSISGHWLGWLIWRSRHTAAQWSKEMGKGRLHRKKKARAEMGEGIQHGERARTKVTVSFYIQLWEMLHASKEKHIRTRYYVHVKISVVQM